MIAFNYGPIAVDEVKEAYKVYGRGVSVRISYVSATSLLLYIANGHSANGDDHSELKDADGETITRVTLTGTGVENLQINGLEPGTYISLKKVSGTGTATMNFITGRV